MPEGAKKNDGIRAHGWKKMMSWMKQNGKINSLIYMIYMMNKVKAKDDHARLWVEETSASALGSKESMC